MTVIYYFLFPYSMNNKQEKSTSTFLPLMQRDVKCVLLRLRKQSMDFRRTIPSSMARTQQLQHLQQRPYDVGRILGNGKHNTVFKRPENPNTRSMAVRVSERSVPDEMTFSEMEGCVRNAICMGDWQIGPVVYEVNLNASNQVEVTMQLFDMTLLTYLRKGVHWPDKGGGGGGVEGTTETMETILLKQQLIFVDLTARLLHLINTTVRCGMFCMDIKPENVVMNILRNGCENVVDTVKLIDFDPDWCVPIPTQWFDHETVFVEMMVVLLANHLVSVQKNFLAEYVSREYLHGAEESARLIVYMVETTNEISRFQCLLRHYFGKCVFAESSGISKKDIVRLYKRAGITR